MTVAVPEPAHLVTDLKTLCLATMATEWRPLAAQATRERQPPAEYLAQLVHLEVTGRRERRIQRRLQEARFPMLKTLDAFQFDAQPELDRDAILQLCSGAFDRALPSTAVDDEQRRQIGSTLEALPDTTLDWGAAIQRELAGLEVAARLIRDAPDPEIEYQRVVGVEPPDGFTVPVESDFRNFERFTKRASEVFQLLPGAARPALTDLDQQLAALHPVFRTLVPSLQRVNDRRTELDAVRQDLQRRLGP